MPVCWRSESTNAWPTRPIPGGSPVPQGERDFGVRASIGEGNRGPNSAQGDEQDDGGDQCARTQTSPAGCQQADGSIVHDGILPAIQPEQMSVAVDRR
ncbi:hypothetical protein J113_24170 [Mycobacterium tuberculosis CAS/NITR204]|uniref:Uncharacterized protein n=1 Tax=Mycobacterium tuberculosis CAS/NITR204 TaxID=1310114 RepID=R4MLW5_MYCTX|nr:hypothetical protein J113_24170 [Mycobacterium tuberculosis CAS/NITR204]